MNHSLRPAPLSEDGSVGVDASSQLNVVCRVRLEYDNGPPSLRLLVLHDVRAAVLPVVFLLNDKGGGEDGALCNACPV